MKKLFAIVAGLLLAAGVGAEVVYWAGDYYAPGDDWSDATNWVDGTTFTLHFVPGTNDHVIIDHDVGGIEPGPFPVVRSDVGAVNILTLGWAVGGDSFMTVDSGGAVRATGFARFGHAPGAVGTLYMKSGSYFLAAILHVGFNSVAENASGSGVIHLDGGILHAGSIGFGEDFADYDPGAGYDGTGVIDITRGRLLINGDMTGGWIQSKIADGQIIAYGGTGVVEFFYDETNAWTEVTAATVYTPNKGYPTLLELDRPIGAGANVTVTGGGAPAGDGIWVELWKVPGGEGAAQSLGSVPAIGGKYTFHGVSVSQGDELYVTLSKSWLFETDGDAEGWDDVVNDGTLTVQNGVLQIVIENLNGDTFTDTFIQNFFDYDPHYYRVIEIRYKNPAEPGPNLGIFWGNPWGTTIRKHGADLEGFMSSFRTYLIPMNLDELDIVPGPPGAGLDGLWDEGTLNDTLRIDPLDNIAENDDYYDGTVFEIDTIRIREDYRREFNDDGDDEGLVETNDIADFMIADGFLSYTTSDVGRPTLPGSDGLVDPYMWQGRMTGWLEAGHFTRAVVGLDNRLLDPGTVVWATFFDDRNSAGFIDGDDGILQRIALDIPIADRTDSVGTMDDLSDPPGYWSKDVGVPTSTLRTDLPDNALEGNQIRIDYIGWIPEQPYGPSTPVVVGPPLGRILSIEWSAPGEVTLAWEDLGPTMRYTVETRDELGAGEWAPAAPAEQWPITATTWTDPSAAGRGRLFYRVVAEEPPTE